MKSYNKINTRKADKFDGITIGDEWSRSNNNSPELSLSCSSCNRTLVKLIDSSGENTSYYCNHCDSEFLPDDGTVRHKQHLSVPQDNEPAIASIGVTPDISIHHEPELKGGFAALAKKGTIRFTSYQES